MFHCGGRINPNADPSMHLRDDVTGRCGKDGACPAGSTCKRVRVCVKPDSGGCNYAAAAPPAVSFLTGLAVLLGLRRRRRREG
jgi:MYXO-CTERM domain-containing protein